MLDDKIKRINELYHKSKAEGLTPEEAKEQQELRSEYDKKLKQTIKCLKCKKEASLASFFVCIVVKIQQ